MMSEVISQLKSNKMMIIRDSLRNLEKKLNHLIVNDSDSGSVATNVQTDPGDLIHCQAARIIGNLEPSELAPSKFSWI